MSKEKQPPPDVPAFPGVHKPGGLGSQEVLDKVAAFSRPTAAPPVDVFTAKKECHRIYVPVTFGQESKVQPGRMDVQASVVPKLCSGAKCALWNPERLECYDVSERRAGVETAVILDRMDGFFRLHSAESGG